MGYDTDRARMETQLAVAHRALYRAQRAAENMQDEGAAHDLEQMIWGVTAIAEASLDRKRRPKGVLKGQMSF